MATVSALGNEKFDFGMQPFTRICRSGRLRHGGFETIQRSIVAGIVADQFDRKDVAGSNID